MRPLKPVRDFNKKSAIKIDWQAAIHQAEKAIKKWENIKCNNEKDWYAKMRSIKLYMDIKRMYRDDDMEAYLTLLDNNRDILGDE